MFAMRAGACAAATCAVVGCSGSTAVDARYPTRESGCPVKSFPGDAGGPVDDLGVATIDCAGAGASCQRQLLDAVCKRGGDVAWGLGENVLTSTHLVAHAAHRKGATGGPRERGCAVRVFTDAPPMPTENIGPVVAVCAEDDSKEVCLRELEDQACLLGGDVLWQIEGPTRDGNKKVMHGRAVHEKAP